MATISTQISDDEMDVTIHVAGRFDFSVQREFRDAYRKHEGGRATFHVNLSGAEYMDSSAMGMLLMLQKHVDGDRSRVVIENASPAIAKVLQIANFDKLFKVA